MKFATLATVSVLLLLLCGCQTTGVDQATAATDTMKEIQVQLNRAPNSIDTVVYKLEDLGKSSGDMRKQFREYCEALDAMMSHAKRVRSLRGDFQAQRDKFTSDWASRLETIRDADLRKQAVDRRDHALAAFKQLSEDADAAKASFDPWMTSIQDVRRYLEHDLNPDGVKSVANRMQQAKTDATEVKAKLATLNKNLGEVIEKMSATKASK